MTEGPDLVIAGDVLLNIAQLALDRVEGVRPTQPPSSVSDLLGGRRARGIAIERDGEDVWVDLTLAVECGVEIPKVAKAAQRAVREGMTSMTGLHVRSVNVVIESVEPSQASVGAGAATDAEAATSAESATGAAGQAAQDRDPWERETAREGGPATSE
ncbi:MAG TPA: Asp23/Gls24 family envelope stress response protein [Trueperaceae bacterium]|nr:Asp23/Gls24 family envelope stress response protein [Trueperaceae bacterium]